MQQLAALFGGTQGSPANPCELRGRSVTQRGDQKLREISCTWGSKSSPESPSSDPACQSWHLLLAGYWWATLICTGTWSGLASMSLELGFLHVLTNIACPTQNIPSHLQERLSETLKRFWGGGKMGRWARRCEGLASEAFQDRGKVEKCKYGRGKKGKQVETWGDSRRATLGERVCQLR